MTERVAGATTGIARRTAASAIWAILGFGAARILSFGTNLLLARMLAPADFGLVSFALIFITACTLLQDLGVTAAIIYGGRDPRAVAGTALTINVLAALGLFVVIVLATPLLAGFQSDPATAAVLIVLALGPVITSLGSVQSALLMRELNYRRKFLPDVVPYAVSGAVSIGMALAGFGVWSLVVGFLIRTVVTTILLWMLTDVRPFPELRWPIAIDLLNYGKHIASQSILGFASSNIDYLVIGYVLGAHALGLYTMAYMVATLVPTLSQAALSVMFPALSRLRDDRAALHALFTDAHRILWALSLPFAILLFVGAPAFVLVVLGERWTESIVPLRILAVATWLQSVGQIYGPASKAVGRPDLLWKYVMIRCLISVPLLLASVQFGIEGVAAGVALIMLVITLPTVIIFCRSLAYPSRRLLTVLAPYMIGAVAMAGLVLAAYVVPGGRDVSESLPGTVVLGSVALLLYATVVYWTDPAFRRLLLKPLGEWRQRSARGAVA
jgi:O-antigen/teichoic acid export membrane protein